MHTLQVYKNIGNVSDLIVDFETEMLSTIHSLCYQNYEWLLNDNFDIFIDDNFQDQYGKVVIINE